MKSWFKFEAPLARKRDVEHIGYRVLKSREDEDHNRHNDKQPRLRLAVRVHRQVHHRAATNREQKDTQRRILQLGRNHRGNIHRVTRQRKTFGRQPRTHKVSRNGREDTRQAILTEVTDASCVERKPLTYNG